MTDRYARSCGATRLNTVRYVKMIFSQDIISQQFAENEKRGLVYNKELNKIKII